MAAACWVLKPEVRSVMSCEYENVNRSSLGLLFCVHVSVSVSSLCHLTYPLSPYLCFCLFFLQCFPFLLLSFFLFFSSLSFCFTVYAALSPLPSFTSLLCLHFFVLPSLPFLSSFLPLFPSYSLCI